MNPTTPLTRGFRGLREAMAFAAIVVLICLLAPWAQGAKPVPVKPAYSAIHVIGDSLSDTGRTGAVLGAAAPISMINGRLSNGPLWIEYASPALGVPYNSLTNFSWAGAYTGHGNVFTGLPGMLDELDELLAPYGSRKHVPKDALYVVFGGSNDFFKILGAGANPFEVIPAAVENLRTIVTTLHERGAKHIVVMDLPDIGLTPRALLQGPAAAGQATALSVYFNTLLDDMLDQLDFVVIRVSTFEVLRSIVADPGAYGFSNTTGMGILDPANADSYVFWDDIHPMTRVHALLANLLLESIEQAVRAPGLPWRGAQGFFWSKNAAASPHD